MFLGSLIFLVLGLMSLFFAIRELRLRAAARHWTRVHGIVRRVVIETLECQAHYDSYSAHLEYEYQFNGELQRGKQNFGQANTHRPTVAARVRDYVAGQEIDVYVNPKRPAQSTLDAKMEYNAVTGIIIGIPAVAISLWNLFR